MSGIIAISFVIATKKESATRPDCVNLRMCPALPVSWPAAYLTGSRGGVGGGDGGGGHCSTPCSG